MTPHSVGLPNIPPSKKKKSKTIDGLLFYLNLLTEIINKKHVIN